jgi:hypothetical protein
MRSAWRILRTVAVVAGLGLTVGCNSANLQVAGAKAALPADESSAGFLDRVSSGQKVTENDAFRGLLLLLDGKDDAKTFEQRVQKLRQRNIIDKTWDCAASRALTKGKLAYMVYQATKLSGGVVLAITQPLFGPTQRYCLRELQYREVMSPGLLLTPVTGVELVSVLGRADTYIRTGKIPDKTGSTDGKYY